MILEHKQMIYTIIIGFFITLILGPLIIPFLKKLKVGQTVREEGPRSHLQKTGTPTIGGLIIIASVLVTSFTAGLINQDLWVAIGAMVAFGLIGFIDDFIKVVLKRSLGLRAYQKMSLQIIVAVFLAIYQSNISVMGTKIIVPFVKGSLTLGSFTIPQYLDLGILYIPFIVFVVVATVNSVNLTDGLDGLASGVTLIVAAFFSILAMEWGYPSLAIFAAAVTGSCLGFLRFNSHPAQVFMGDTGSLALGGAISAVAILMNVALIVPIVGGIYFAEALSVILQVISFKLTGKRIFKMSPLHHHYELSGWAETKVVIVFWIVTVILCLIGMLGLN
ncbi:phospho-N-acetylmuramoyl-pentapeptide-transferase [Alkaliphilus oremlandii]|uniref:Phospho-N-acetylmuramoyl-pentapeptide-transferase n=1 Tax=Alkaliphilus oremlandii (strain OhILAs) TaxID=350688 RepID=MRAY_ALKOO|nr:phospho-N-acetylmuramoyl-pentapeptide-transferase [Alkaliphilus oremlandii]A8MH33.1 RecName: Full=Phospho-N-acetylmuramoyl-pentapeptide-transferase; AltName: Full=UDP-MurNAc-pentapeptide phosphotransferase [Alkaliphilus oremlandii OhILAs]ABW18920.1 phospho-N-acetylmuramoyl-pentapeptide-transferase [Alkaliphilus oremlandii OhILAs]